MPNQVIFARETSCGESAASVLAEKRMLCRPVCLFVSTQVFQGDEASAADGADLGFRAMPAGVVAVTVLLWLARFWDLGFSILVERDGGLTLFVPLSGKFSRMLRKTTRLLMVMGHGGERLCVFFGLVVVLMSLSDHRSWFDRVHGNHHGPSLPRVRCPL
jgi:hypothetical protein